MSNNSGLYSIIGILAFLCLLIGVLAGYSVGVFKEDNCVMNPLYYGISQMETDSLKITCSCYFNKQNYNPFFFNSTGVFPYGN